MAAKDNDFRVLDRDFKSGDFKKIYLLYGDEENLVRTYKERFRDAFGGKDSLNFTVIYGNHNVKRTDVADENEIKSILETMPFFATSRLVMVIESGFFDLNPSDKFIEYLEKEMPDTSHLVFVESKVSRVKKFYKFVKNKGMTVDFARLDEKTLAAYVAMYLGHDKKKIRESTVNYFLAFVGNNLDNIFSELDKLIAYTGDRVEIKKEDIDAICERNLEDQVFDMLDALFDGNKKKVVVYYKDICALGSAPMMILALIRSNINKLLKVKEAVEKHRDLNSAASEIGMPYWLLKKISAQASKYSIETLENYVKKALECDIAIKEGRLTDVLALETFIFN